MQNKIAPNNVVKRVNNFVDQNQIPKEIQYLIKLEALFGVNRLKLVCDSKLILILSYLYTSSVVLLTVYFRALVSAHSAAQTTFNITVASEYFILSLAGVYKGALFVELFGDIRTDVSNSKHRYMLSFILIFCYDVCEFVLNDAYFYPNLGYGERCAIFVALFTHDIETLFFCSLLVLILRRMELLRVRVTRLYTKEAFSSGDLSPATTALYKEYELIFKCSKHLNNLIGLPILIMLISSGVCTVLIMKTVVHYFNSNAMQHYNAMVVGIARCLKYIFLIVALCYHATVTSNQVEAIQVILQEALNTQDLTKTERRNIKAFLQLSRDSAVEYQLAGLVRLSMAVPLSYCSVCTTYLLIVIQFSKFFD